MRIKLEKLLIEADSIFKIEISFKSKHDKMELRIESGKTTLARRIITGDRDSYTTVFQNKSSKAIHAIAYLTGTKSIIQENIALKLRKICPIYKDCSFQSNDESITASIATYPPRINTLPTAINSLIDQVDHLFIYLNNYKSVPELLLSHPKNEKITYILDSSSTKRAAAKFFWVDKIKGTHLTCDDDIEYPNDYVKTLISQLCSSPERSIIGVHAVTYKDVVQDPIGSRLHVYNFKDNLNKKTKVHLVGTGTLCFHTKILNSDGFDEIWDYAASTDEWLACFAKKRNIDLYTIPRDKNWMKSIDGMQFGLHEEKQVNQQLKSLARNLLIQNNPWPSFDDNKSISTVTVRNPLKFGNFLRQFFPKNTNAV